MPRGKAIVDAAWAPFLSTSALFRFAAVTVLMRLSRFLKICGSASIERSRRMTHKERGLFNDECGASEWRPFGRDDKKGRVVEKERTVAKG